MCSCIGNNNNTNDDNINDNNTNNNTDDNSQSNGCVDNNLPNEDTKTEDEKEQFPGYYEVLDGVYVNYLPGYYEEDIALDFKFEDEGGMLFYSLDCEKPTYLYRGSINVEFTDDLDIKNYPLTTSVDAIIADDPKPRCISNMYINNVQNPGNYYLTKLQNVVTIKFIDSNGNESQRSLTYLNKTYDIPVVSLSMPYDDWFGSRDGFYNRISEEIEKRVNIEYFDSTYNEYFYRNSKIKIGGNWSVGYPQRTLNLNFNKDENGNKNKPVSAHIFEERSMLGNSEQRLTDLTRFRLHNGGNNFEERSGFNDAILQNLMYGTNASTTAYRPCITYLNGEFWGIYSIREHYSDTYFEDNYGVNKDDVTLYELKGQITFDDGNEYQAMQFIERMNNYLLNDFSKDIIYENFIDKYIDVDSFIDVIIAHSYAGNWDFIGNSNNLKFWRTVNIDSSNPYADGKLRFCLHDIDFAFTDTQNYLNPNVNYSYTNFKLYKKLLENRNFRIRLYERAEELIATNLSNENAQDVVYSMVEEVMYYKLASMKRWGNTAAYSDWRRECESVINYIKERNKTYLNTLKKTLNL